MIKFENLPRLRELKETHGLFMLGTVVRENSEPLYLVWSTVGVCALLLSSEDLVNPVVYCALDEYAKPKRNVGLSALIFNSLYIDNEPIAFYGVRTGNKLQDILFHISSYLSLSKDNEDTIYDIYPFTEKSLTHRVEELIKKHIQ